MNQLDMLTTLVEAACQMPENKMLTRALKQANKRLDVLRARRDRRMQRQSAHAAVGVSLDSELAAIAQANPERFEAAGRCAVCGYFKPSCICSFDPISVNP